MAIIEKHYHFHFHNDDQKEITHKLNQIQMTNAELLELLLADDAKVDKLITEIQALKDLVANSQNVPQNIVDAVNNLGAKLQTADDLNPDV